MMNVGDDMNINLDSDIARAKKEKTLRDLLNRLDGYEHFIWKRNTPLLYDLLISHTFEWPSLTVQWLPERVDLPDSFYSVQKVVLGTHTQDEPNYLIIAQVKLPLQDEYEIDEVYGPLYSVDAQSKLISSVGCKVEVVQQIHHDGEVHRARHMPQEDSIIASMTASSEIHVFDIKNHPNKPPLDRKCNPDLRLRGHTKDGFGLSWSTLKKGHLLSGSSDSKICVWDINGNPVNKALDPVKTIKVHSGAVKDVSWHLKHDFLFASCGADRYFHMFDIRSPFFNRPIQTLRAHTSEINCLSFNLFNEWLVATGSSDMTMKLFDLRKFTGALHTFNQFKGDVVQVGWSPHNEAILTSGSADSRLILWDLSRIGQEQLSKDAEDGPPEMLFKHSEHRDRVSDFSWNPSEDWIIASVSADNILQVWQMADYGEVDDPKLPKSFA